MTFYRDILCGANFALIKSHGNNKAYLILTLSKKDNGY